MLKERVKKLDVKEPEELQIKPKEENA